MTTAPTAATTGIPEKMLRLIDRFDGPDRRILEVGSSAGLHTAGLRGRVTVLDLDEDKLRQSGRFPNIEQLVVHDLSAGPLPVEGPFDVILCLEVLEHLEWDDAVTLLAQLEGLCRGCLIVSTPHITNFTQLIRYALTRQLDLTQAHTAVERLLYRLRHGVWFDVAGETARLRQQEKTQPNLGRHKCAVPAGFFRRRGYALSGGVSLFLLGYPFMRHLARPAGALLEALPVLSGTTWASRTRSHG